MRLVLTVRSKTIVIRPASVFTVISDDYGLSDVSDTLAFTHIMDSLEVHYSQLLQQLEDNTIFAIYFLMTFGLTNDLFLADDTECVLAVGGWLYVHLQEVYQFLPDI